MPVRVLLSILLVLLFTGCAASRNSSDAVLPAGQLQSASGLPTLADLPDSPAVRQSSSTFALEQNGVEAATQSLTAIPDADKLLLPSGSNFTSWGIWSFDAGYNYPTQISVVMNLAGEDSAWVALSNYETGRWEFHGPYSSGIAIELDSRYKSAGRGFSCAVLTEGGSSATVQKLVLTTDDGWEVLDLQQTLEGSSLSLLSAAMIDNRPAVAFLSPDGVISFLHADDPLAPTLADWPASAAALFGGVQEMPALSLAEVNGKPALAFITQDGSWSLHFAASTTAAGAAADWQLSPSSIDSGTAYQPEVSLAEVQGRPAIAFVSSADHLEYVRSKTSDGLGAADWDDRIVIEENDTVNEHFDSPRLVNIRGKPFVSYLRNPGQVLAVSSTADGGGKLADWSKPDVISRWQDGDWVEHSTFLHDGNPVHFHMHDESASGNDKLFLVLADTFPTEEGWEYRRLARESYSLASAFPSGTEINSLPAVAYRNSSKLIYSFTDPEAHPQNPYYDWEHQEVDDGSQHSAIFAVALLENTEGQPCIVYSAFDDNLQQHRLWYAVRSEH